MNTILPTSSLRECGDLDSASNTYQHYFSLIYKLEKSNWMTECPVPCKQTVYEVNLQKYHKNNVGAEGNYSDALIAAGVMFSLKCSKFVIEQHVEALIYDTGNFLTQAGGNLGLFLGFSCLSILLSCVRFFKRLLTHRILKKKLPA